MAYKVTLLCDKCNTGYQWYGTPNAPAPSRSMARSVLKRNGWYCGKNGDYCPDCQPQNGMGIKKTASQGS